MPNLRIIESTSHFKTLFYRLAAFAPLAQEAEAINAKLAALNLMNTGERPLISK